MKYLKYLFVLVFVAGCTSMNTPIPAPHIGPLKLNNSTYVPIPDSNGVTFLNNLNNALSGITGIEPQFDTYTLATLPSVTQNRVVFCQDCSTSTLSCSGGGTGTLAFNTGSAWLCLSSQASGGPPSGPAGGDLGGTYPNPTVISGAHLGATTVPNSALVTDPTNANNLSSGTVNCSRLPALTGDTSTSAGSCSTTTAKVNGVTISGTPATGNEPIATSSSASSWTAPPYDIGVNFPTPTTSQVISFSCTRTVNFPANFTTPTSQANCGSNPGETDAYTVAVAGSSIGTVSLSTSCVATLTTVGGATKSCTAGQQLTITAPGTVSGSNISITLTGTR